MQADKPFGKLLNPDILYIQLHVSAFFLSPYCLLRTAYSLLFNFSRFTFNYCPLTLGPNIAPLRELHGKTSVIVCFISVFYVETLKAN
jgi:hypothetical protein